MYIGVLALSACGLFLSEDAQLKRALEAQQKGDLRAASIDLKNLLGKHPNNREARFALGVVELDSGDAAAAAHDLERARTDGVVIERVTEPLARAYAVQRQFDKALQLIDAQTAAASKDGKANDKDPARYERLRGEILLATRDFPGARSAFEAVLNTAPNDVRAILGLASAVEAIEGNTNALKIIDRALEVAPDDVNVLLARGTMLMQMRQTNDAAAMFQKAAEIATRPAQKAQLLASLSGLAQSQLVLGQVEPALKTTARMQELAPNSPVTRYAHAYALAQNGELDKARELLEQNISQAEDVRSKLLLGAVNLSQGRYAQAEMQLSAVVAVAPNNNEARQLLAESRLRQAKPADALETLLPSIEKNTNASANLIALAAQASFAAGKTKEGVELLKRNVTQHPQDEKPKLDLAAGYLAAGQADQALAILDATSDKSSKTSGKDDHNEAAPKTQETETQLVRREYLNVLARVQKGDSSGAVAHATRVAQDHPEDATLQSLASAVLMAQRQFAKARPYAEAVVHLRPDDAAGYTNLGRLDILEGNVNAAKNSFQ
ncbi:MAG TPA: tetratricopeptide repeat protein, partial [Steroidobacteraceae bacterium]|nr:tetratricopeptide repeat protein [Steroidobacteraceae bacterium]